MSHDSNRCRIISRNGAGNHYITHSILSHLYLDITEVFVLFSGFSRIDMPLPKSMEPLVEFSHVSREDDAIWLHSGGWAGTWNLDCQDPGHFTTKYFKSQYLAMDWDYLNRQSLARIAGCLNTLESKKIPYTWGFIYDIHRDYADRETSFGGPVPKHEPLLQLLPWHRCLPITPYEHCQDLGLMSSDGFHPSAEGWQNWFQSLGDWRPKNCT